MKKFLAYFSKRYIFLAILLVIAILVNVPRWTRKPYVRTNQVQTNPQRVFDGADILTAQEEAELQAYIEKKQAQVGIDIVIVTTLAPYPEGTYDPYRYVMNMADDLYDNGCYGYDKPNVVGTKNTGHGVLFLDNYNRDYDGYAYSWLSCSGKCQQKINDDAAEDIVESITGIVNEHPLRAYKKLVDRVCEKVDHKLGWHIPTFLIVVIAVIGLFMFRSSHKRDKGGVKTTTARTYVVEGTDQAFNTVDHCYNKSVTYVVIQSSSSGGGGGHSSSGGHSHSGGGGRH